MKYSPHEYQRYATEYIETHPVAAVLLSMGLGKTSITLTALRSTKPSSLRPSVWHGIPGRQRLRNGTTWAV